MQMSKVTNCEANSCYYNQNNVCHANAITVGSECPCCETYVQSAEHGVPATNGQVGACHISDCKFNNLLSCQASGIKVGCHSGHADCETYSPK